MSLRSDMGLQNTHQCLKRKQKEFSFIKLSTLSVMI